MRSSAAFRVVIAGGGAAGSLVAIQLARAWPAARPLQVTLLDRGGAFGRGVAYATDDPAHLLNVTADAMSAFADRPADFALWADARGLAERGGRSFVPRAAYGAYLSERLAAAERAHPGAIHRRVGAAVAIATAARDMRVHLADGGVLAADAVVLATGLSRPSALPGVAIELGGDPRLVEDPWDTRRLRGLAARHVVIAGTGLTMVDAALTLARRPDCRVTAVSRSGLLPRAHRDQVRAVPPPVVRPEEGPWRADELAARVAAAARAARDWRSAVDSLRPVSVALWRSLGVEEQRRFLAVHARCWDVHRHRMAPAVAARVRELRAQGRLQVRAATIGAVRGAADGSLRVALDGTAVHCHALIIATGPDLALARGGDPLVRQLVADGLAVADPLGIGLRAGPDGELAGAGDGRLFALGALLRGERWETTAIPEIRAQATAIAGRLSRLANARSRWALQS